jgi:hypothetical protein
MHPVVFSFSKVRTRRCKICLYFYYITVVLKKTFNDEKQNNLFLLYGR